jgi:hypothetical protein
MTRSWLMDLLRHKIHENNDIACLTERSGGLGLASSALHVALKGASDVLATSGASAGTLGPLTVGVRRAAP